MCDLNELRVVMALAGAKRLPHLEEEIFANTELTTIYLNNLCKDTVLYSRSGSNTLLAVCYALCIMCERWPAAEALIYTNPGYWRDYCREFKITNE